MKQKRRSDEATKRRRDGTQAEIPGPQTPILLADFATRAGVSDRTLRSYCAEGMPHTRGEPVRSGGPRAYLIADPDAALAWIKDNHGAGELAASGGKREGAGRPKTAGSGFRVPGSQARDPGPETRDPKQEAPLSPPAPSTHDAPATLRSLEKLNNLALKRRRLMEDILVKQSERMAAEGQLVDRFQAAKEWEAMLTAFRRHAEMTAPSMADRMMQLVSASLPKAPTRSRVLEIAEQEIDRLLEKLASGEAM